MSTEPSLVSVSDEDFLKISNELDHRLSVMLRDMSTEFNVNGIELTTVALAQLAQAIQCAFQRGLGVKVSILSMIQHIVDTREAAREANPVKVTDLSDT